MTLRSHFALFVAAALATACKPAADPPATTAASVADPDAIPPRVHRISAELACTETSATAGPRCEAREGCAWRPALHCWGIRPDLGLLERIAAQEAAGEPPCTCVCQSDRVECMKRP